MKVEKVMNKLKTDQRGLTLIEIVVTLLLVGITTALAGLWIVSVANGYLFSRMNMDTAQKAQLAMTRLAKEFKGITTVTAASSASISYTRPDITSGTVNATVAFNGSNLQINGNTLADNVSEFTLAYCSHVTSSCAATWSPEARIIEITLKLKGADNAVSTFTQRVVPRNL